MIVTDLESALSKFFLFIKESEQPIEFALFIMKKL